MGQENSSEQQQSGSVPKQQPNASGSAHSSSTSGKIAQAQATATRQANPAAPAEKSVLFRSKKSKKHPANMDENKTVDKKLSNVTSVSKDTVSAQAMVIV